MQPIPMKKESSKAERRDISLGQKRDTLTAIHTGRRKKDVAIDMGISSFTLSTILNDRSNIEAYIRENSVSLSRMKLKAPTRRY
jgi:FixJ family two-component response regulator